HGKAASTSVLVRSGSLAKERCFISGQAISSTLSTKLNRFCIFLKTPPSGSEPRRIN
ncbi:uncharacterized protein METZ01_LOCUS369685, partial [marine metagenome]